MEEGKNKAFSWLQENVVTVLIAFFILLIAVVGVFSYVVSGLKTDLTRDSSNTINKTETSNLSDLQGSPQNQGEQTQPITSAAQLEVVASDNPEVGEIAKKVFRHVFLPSGNVQILTIEKVDELKKQNPIFYQFAKVGDQVLVYSDRAILYDPVADLVLDIVHFAEAKQETK